MSADSAKGKQGPAPKRPSEGMIRTVVSDAEYQDQYAAKWVKYIPAEVLAAFIPLVALADKISSGSKDFWIWIAIGVAAVSVVGYNRWHATEVIPGQVKAPHGRESTEPWDIRKINSEVKRLTPSWYFYILSVIAFGAWALATAAPVRSVVGLSAAEAEYIVAAVTLALPLLDVTLPTSQQPLKRHGVQNDVANSLADQCEESVSVDRPPSGARCGESVGGATHVSVDSRCS